ncbi:hypothetical protein [Pseudomonas fluorescens]|uniref:hypothetical protein n=1 Tax=Pseudomonas fluorescens TaxID=294 RepID=UPI0006422347|nr:hypothetical protein [Pseudomonas fluorescens]
MSFTLCYTYKDKRVVAKVSVDHLTPYAAVCFALLQSGATNDSSGGSWPETYEGILEIATQYGLTDLSFHRSLKS